MVQMVVLDCLLLFNVNKLNKPDNIHIYKYNTDFTDSNKYVDNSFWNLVSGFDDAGQDGKINIHSYIEQAKCSFRQIKRYKKR
ncbi:hypothetical protein B10583_03440 [Campylobacter jejuni]|nr:hypothetical protein B10583_03440 [Campylobacter jejuni]